MAYDSGIKSSKVASIDGLYNVQPKSSTFVLHHTNNLPTEVLDPESALAVEEVGDIVATMYVPLTKKCSD